MRPRGYPYFQLNLDNKKPQRDFTPMHTDESTYQAVFSNGIVLGHSPVTRSSLLAESGAFKDQATLSTRLQKARNSIEPIAMGSTTGESVALMLSEAVVRGCSQLINLRQCARAITKTCQVWGSGQAGRGRLGYRPPR